MWTFKLNEVYQVFKQKKFSVSHPSTPSPKASENYRTRRQILYMVAY
jgi:hypothetical protein